MREYKFRAKERSGEWHVGSLFVEDGMGIPYIVSGVNTHYETNYSTVEVVSETVGQFTGLKDCKGREIYEGDICKLPSGNIGLVTWDEELAGFVMCDDEPGDTIEFSSCTIIGNVHDNPEILEDDGWVRGDDDGL